MIHSFIQYCRIYIIINIKHFFFLSSIVGLSSVLSNISVISSNLSYRPICLIYHHSSHLSYRPLFVLYIRPILFVLYIRPILFVLYIRPFLFLVLHIRLQPVISSYLSNISVLSCYLSFISVLSFLSYISVLSYFSYTSVLSYLSYIIVLSYLSNIFLLSCYLSSSIYISILV